MKSKTGLKLAQEAYEASTNFLDTNWRADIDYSIKTFRGEHAGGSKYLSPEYAHRSKLVSPKTRSIIRKNEAAGAVALFSNMDIVNLDPGNPDDVMSVAGTAAMKEILEYRLQKSIPTFEICLGGIQDAQTQGVVCSYQYWEYQKKNGRKIKDKPCIELRPIENIRLDGGASWLDPVNTSPYFCDIIPMYVCDVRGMMNSKDDKTGNPKFKTFKDDVILKARPDMIDTTRQARLGKQQDPHKETTGIKEFDIVWVMRWFMRDSDGDDFVYYTLGTEELLTDPKPIEEVYFHGKRPYEMGYAILETHKVMKTSVPTLVKPIHMESTELRNQRLDNVKFVLNKRWIVARGRQVDVQSLVRNVPGGVTLATDPKNDVQESNWPDVTSSAYVEHDRLNAEFDDLAGNFSPSTKVANNAINDTLGGSRMAAQSAGIMTDYLLRTIVETWWEKVLRQLVLLEAHYESDEIVLGICADKARLFPRFGLSSITDSMLEQEMTLTVNVGFGASDPTAQLQKFIAVTTQAIQMVTTAPPGFNVQEAIKELYSKAGYRDGARFFNEKQDPRLLKAMQMVQQLQGMLKGKQMELQSTAQLEQAKLLSNERIKDKQLQMDYRRIQGDLQIRAAELEVERQRLALEEMQIRASLYGASEEHKLRIAELGAAVEQAHLKLDGERQKMLGQAAKLSAEVQKAQSELVTTKDTERTATTAADNQSRIGEVADQVTKAMRAIGSQVDAIKSELAGHGDQISAIKNHVVQVGQGVGMVLHGVAQKKTPKGLKLKKADGKKTSAVVIDYHDGSSEEMPVG